MSAPARRRGASAVSPGLDVPWGAPTVLLAPRPAAERAPRLAALAADPALQAALIAAHRPYLEILRVRIVHAA